MLRYYRSQESITEDMIVTELSCRDFQTGLSYVAVSRVKMLEGLMLDALFDRGWYEDEDKGSAASETTGSYTESLQDRPRFCIIPGDSAREKKKCYKNCSST
jgi:hypothetical protein